MVQRTGSAVTQRRNRELNVKICLLIIFCDKALVQRSNGEQDKDQECVEWSPDTQCETADQGRDEGRSLVGPVGFDWFWYQ